ncbi:MAG TPA: amidase, partial [Burkholderiales bacterium]|nr:amidase [Burkholderiales bacterium]
MESPGTADAWKHQQGGNATMQELHKLTATQAVALLRRREVSPLELIDAAAARIEATNPKINALVTLCIDRAREHASRIMRETADDRPPHFLHGLPIAVKDNTDVAGVRCTSGSRIYADRIAPASDLVVQRLEANGAVVIGKSNLPEFAAGGNTFNDVFGATCNPWDTRMSASGSSGGAAAALAAGQVWLATGGDFGGSIRTPASFCSITGLRPSPGMVPRVQKQPFSPLSVEGPMARTVADVALMFDAEAGFHPFDPLSQVGP